MKRFRTLWLGLFLVFALGAGCAACAPRNRSFVAVQPQAQEVPAKAPAMAQQAAEPASPVPAPTLHHEVPLRILLARGTNLLVKQNGREMRAQLSGSQWRWGEQRLSLDQTLSLPKATYSVQAVAEGATRFLDVRGSLDIRPIAGALEICETLPLEDYIARVLPSEMNPRWPKAALAAQAIAMRSYAASRYLERIQENWQLHWHFTVDMAYYGAVAGTPESAEAVRSTRGQMLMCGDQPVQAVFHASSGGRTEDFAVFKPGVMAPDGRTPIAPAMPSVNDPYALPGAAGLGFSASHGQWKMDLPLPELSRRLAVWSAGGAGRPRFGAVESVSIETRFSSGRVDQVMIRHSLPGQKPRFDRLSAKDFRFAVGPTQLRSTWWERCVVAAKAPGYVVIQGRGYGHGCGLSQVSAWEMARQGFSAEAIVQYFYPGARLERRY